MPDLDGHGALHALCDGPRTASIAFIVLAARAERRDQRAGMALGPDDYLTTPATVAELLVSIAARPQRR